MSECINIILDEMPYCIELPTWLDYSGRLLSGAISTPLLTLGNGGNKPQPYGAEKVVIDRTRTKYVLYLNKNFRFEDGQSIRSFDYFMGIRKACKHIYWRIILNVIETVTCVSDYILRIDLKYPCEHFLYILCAPDISAQKFNSGKFFTGGVYKIVHKDNSTVCFSPNFYFPCDKTLPDLNFLLERDMYNALTRFDNGEVDITCNTSFPFESRQERKKLTTYKEYFSGLIMSLEFGQKSTKKYLKYPSIRKELFKCINKRSIANKFDHAFEPVYNFIPHSMKRFWSLNHEYKNALVPRLPKYSALVLGYHDYFPNKEIASDIAEIWRQSYGIEVAIKAIPFFSRQDHECDFMLIIKFPPYPHPLAYIDYIAGHNDLTKETRLMILRRIKFGFKNSSSYYDLERRIYNDAVVFPLFELKSIYHQSNKIEGFCFPQTASFDFRELRVLK